MSHLSNNSAIALALNSVGYRIPGGKSLLSDISFHVHPGEIVVLAGPNGAGKTSLIKMIAGLTTPTSGNIFLENRSYADLGYSERAKHIAYVGQVDNPDGQLTVRHYVALGRLPHRGVLARSAERVLIEEALKVTAIDHLVDRYLTQLSGGERQRAKIARAICQRPQLLTLDEPTNHLDPCARGNLLNLISNLGITIIAALHDLTLIESFATHVAIIEDGKLIAYGHPDEILSPSMVRDIFEVDMHRLAHPTENRFIPTLDIRISKTVPALPPERTFS